MLYGQLEVISFRWKVKSYCLGNFYDNYYCEIETGALPYNQSKFEFSCWTPLDRQNAQELSKPNIEILCLREDYIYINIWYQFKCSPLSSPCQLQQLPWFLYFFYALEHPPWSPLTSWVVLGQKEWKYADDLIVDRYREPVCEDEEGTLQSFLYTIYNDDRWVLVWKITIIIIPKFKWKWLQPNKLPDYCNLKKTIHAGRNNPEINP